MSVNTEVLSLETEVKFIADRIIFTLEKAKNSKYRPDPYNVNSLEAAREFIKKAQKALKSPVEYEQRENDILCLVLKVISAKFQNRAGTEDELENFISGLVVSLSSLIVEKRIKLNKINDLSLFFQTARDLVK